MGYAKKRYRKRNFKKRPWYKRKYNAMEIAGKALSGVSALKKLVNVEHKKQDFTGSTSVPNAWTNMYYLHNVDAGDSVAQRDGNSIRAVSLSGLLQIYQHATATKTVLRVLIVKDNQTVADQTTLSGGTIFESNTEVYGLLNRSALGRFSVLYDKHFNMTAGMNSTITASISIPLNTHLRYNGATGSDIAKNGIYMLAISNEPTYQPAIDNRLRLTFIDN